MTEPIINCTCPEFRKNYAITFDSQDARNANWPGCPFCGKPWATKAMTEPISTPISDANTGDCCCNAVEGRDVVPRKTSVELEQALFRAHQHERAYRAALVESLRHGLGMPVWAADLIRTALKNPPPPAL